MKRIDTLICARWVVPIEPATVLDNHAVAISDGRIVDLLPTTEATRKYQPTQRIDRPRHALLPGFVNAHTHAAMTLLRGIADDLPLDVWLQEHIWPAEGKWLSEAFVRDGTLLAIAEMIRSGTTTFNDMYLFPDIAAECVTRAGIRAAIGIVVIDFPTPWARDADEYLSKGLALHDELKDDALISIQLAPHAPYTVADGPLSRVATLANELDLPVHIHLHETEGEVARAAAADGRRPIQRLRDLGLLGPNLLAVHMTALDDSDIALAAEYNIHVVHCPESNLKLASGICPVTRLQDAGINIALGTDGTASNNDLDMLGEMRTAALLAKGHSGDASRLSAQEALTMATLGGARALGIADRIGSIVPGKAADLIAVDLEAIETLPHYDPASALIYSAGREQITDSWVAGRALMRDRLLTTLDEAALREKARQWQQRITSDTAEPS